MGIVKHTRYYWRNSDQPDDQVQKIDCIGHVQKRMGTALRNLKKHYRGQKLSDGKTIGGHGRLTKKLIDSLQNYYGRAIKENKGDLPGMMKAVQATLLHFNSTNEQPRHHLCPISWCKWQHVKKENKEKEYNHKHPAIVQVIKPIYAHLGSRSLLEVDTLKTQMSHCISTIILIVFHTPKNHFFPFSNHPPHVNDI